jgi:hypothetical protein
METDPEEILEFSDWMGIPLEAYQIKLDRLQELLLAEVKR